MAKNCLLCGKKLALSDNYTYTRIGDVDYPICIPCSEAVSIAANPARWNDSNPDEVISESIEYVKTNLPNCIDDRAREFVKNALQDRSFSGMTFLDFQKYCRERFEAGDEITDIDNILRINDTKKEFAVLARGKYVSLHKYEELVDFNVDEDGQSITSGRAGSAVIGALLLGATGAIIGSAGSKTTKQTVQSLDIILSFRGLDAKLETIHLLESETQKGSEEYIRAAQTCKRIISALKQIMDFGRSGASEGSGNAEQRGRGVAIYAFSVADEILKFKGLLDQGIITQEEFDKQKEKLLALEY